MLVFIVPLKSSKVSTSWNSVCQLFERCVKSICNQTSKDFRVIVVCHEKPQINFTHSHVEYIEVDFPIPTSKYDSKEKDRTRKILTGLINAKKLNPSHIMFVDADDCLNRKIAEFVNLNSQANGWFVKKGYLYRNGMNSVRLMRKGFDQYCGTSNIIRYDLFGINQTKVEDEIVEKIHNNYRHREIKDTLAQKGAVLEPLPFAGAIYVIGNGENIYYENAGIQKKSMSFKTKLLRMKALLDNRLLTKSFRNEFGLWDINSNI